MNPLPHLYLHPPVPCCQLARVGIQGWKTGLRLAALLLLTIGKVNAQTILTSDTTLGISDLHLENQSLVVRGVTLTVSGEHRFQSLILTNGATLTHPTNTATPPHLIFAGDFSVSADSRVDLTGRGEPEGEGAGAGPASSCCSAGGSHGGTGGPSEGGLFGHTHGSFAQPTALGSGGGRALSFGEAGAGAGALRISALGDVRIDGQVRLDGTDGGRYAGGGAGGSLWIQARRLLGHGTLSAQGGAGEERAGGGGGGRIALYFDSDDFTGDVRACGGVGGEAGKPGGA
ncbi:MAG: hypothetical protein IT580_22405, partial [Verrucomicrobiales bacterium]|nr:hypothetical protein [Verrucomicrobiales bacterium]